MKVDGALKSLLQGVSQQPIRERLPGQCTEQINFLADPVTGLTRRPPTDLVAALPSPIGLSGENYAFNFKTRTGEGFFAQIAAAQIRVWDLNGVRRNTTVESGVNLNYFTGNDFANTVVGNEIYVVNRKRVVNMGSAVSTYPNTGTGRQWTAGIIQVLGGSFARAYTVHINGVQRALYLTPDGSESGHTHHTRASEIAIQLQRALTTVVDVAIPGGGRVVGTGFMSGSEWAVDRVGDTLLIKLLNGSSFALSTNDDAGGTVIKSITNVAQAMEDLPKYAPNGYAVRIAENSDENFDIWMTFVTESPVAVGTGFGQIGFWKEAIAPNMKLSIDPNDMPHILEYIDSDGSFRVKRMDLRERRTGNDVSNPIPSFVGNTINDVSLFQSRLMLTAGNYLVGSRTNRLGDFWINSITTIADTDPIDIGSNAQEAASLEWIVPHNKDLVIFTPSAQFLLYGRTGITPNNASLTLTTVFESDSLSKPESCGKNVFFPNTFGRFSGIREFFTEISGEVNDTRTIVPHVKRYIVGRVTQMAASSNYDTLLCRTSVDKDTLYVYQFIWADSEKIQSAWHKYTFPDEVYYTFWDQAVVYIISRVGNSLYMSRMFLDVEESEGVGYGVHLDYRYDVFDVYDQFILPVDGIHDHPQVAVQGSACPNPGMVVPIESITHVPGTGYVAQLKYDMLGGDIIVGVPYRSSYIPTPPMLKDESGVAIDSAKIKLKSYIASMSNTGHIAGRKMSKYGDYPAVHNIGRYVGGIDNIIGEQPITDFKFKVPIRELSTQAEVELFTDSPFPATILDIEWNGQYWKSGRRINTGD